MQPPRKTVLVTGASTGIGRATVELLAAEGFLTLGGVRRHGADQPLPELPPGVVPVELDVTSDAHVAAAVKQVEREFPDGLFALVNNAGVAPPAPVELIDPDVLRDVLEVNTVAPLRMIQAFLPLLRKGSGRIINITSINGTVAQPMVGAYSASKFALEALSTSLRIEMRPWGIPVTVIRPGQIRTAIFDKAQEALKSGAENIPPELVEGYGALYEQASKFVTRGATRSATPDAVARKIVKALRSRRPRDRYYVGWDAIGLQIGFEYSVTKLFDWCLAAAMGLNHKVKK